MLNQNEILGIETAVASKLKQDPKIPLLIHMVDGRLIPNNAMTAKNTNYRPYTGPVQKGEDDEKALAARLRWLKTSAPYHRAVIDTTEEEPFDLGKATEDEIIAFAFNNFGLVLKKGTPISDMRKKVMMVAQAQANSPQVQAAASALG